MYHSRFMRMLAAANLFLTFGITTAWSGVPGRRAVAIDEFSYLDTSGEPGDQTAVHQKRLRAFMTALRGDIARDQRFDLVASTTDDRSSPAQRLRAASQKGARLLIVGAVQKTSTLVQWARVAGIEVPSGHVIYKRLFTFRGDNDESWRRAEAFISEQIRSTLGGAPVQAAVAAPIRLAVFPFELEDMSAAAGSVGETPADARELDNATVAVRQLLAQSARYQVIDAGTAGTGVVKAPSLHDCSGCEAQIALALSAEQALVGVIRRISRTEYTVRFRVRDAHSGAAVTGAESGLRMGANYSWSRGAARLVQDRLLDSGPRQ